MQLHQSVLVNNNIMNLNDYNRNEDIGKNSIL